MLKVNLLSDAEITLSNSAVIKHGMGVMALNRCADGTVLGRSVPDNTIFAARLEGCVLSGIKTLIEPNVEDVKNVDLGFQDPTFIGDNEFAFTNAYLQGNKVRCDLALAHKGSDGRYILSTILNHSDCGSLAENVDMVKELEFINPKESNDVIFEFTDGRSSHIALAKYRNGKITDFRTFINAGDDGSEHVSTCGSPIRLNNGDWLLFFNRCRDSVWGVAWLTMSPDLVINHVSEEYVILPKIKAQSGMSIAFGSCVSVTGGHIEILYHIDDRKPARALINLSQ